MAICLLKGTRIATPTGEVSVEALAIGDLVTTVTGAARPVKWVGRQRFRRAPGRSAWVDDVKPVLIRAHALGGGLPLRDLFVSPGHGMFLDGAFVPASYLVNGRSITVEASVHLETIEYFNVELETHDVILAEGAPVETFLSRHGHREKFDNFFEYERLYGPETEAQKPYAPKLGQHGTRSRVRSVVTRALAPLVDRRTPLDRIRDKLGAR